MTQNTEPSEKNSAAWNAWALAQVGAGGFPVYGTNPITGAVEPMEDVIRAAF